MLKNKCRKKTDNTQILSHYGHTLSDSHEAKSFKQIQHPSSNFWANNASCSEHSSKTMISANNAKLFPVKYIAPKTQKQKKQDEERRKQYVESLNFCKKEVLDASTVKTDKLKVNVRYI